MLLAIDIGNTNMSIGCFEGEKLLFTSRMKTDPSRMSDQYAIELRDILDINGASPNTIDGAIISSVVPPLTAGIKDAIRKITGCTPLSVGPGIKTGLNIRIDNPGTLGADMVAGCVAALERYPVPTIVFDMGTATTIAVLDAQKNMVGGCIMAGIRISMEALATRTAQLPHISLDAPAQVVGKNTVDSMKSGTVFGTASMIDGMCDRIEDELGMPCTVIATGGFSPVIIPHCRRSIILDENLLLDGLRIMYERNTEK